MVFHSEKWTGDRIIFAASISVLNVNFPQPPEMRSYEVSKGALLQLMNSLAAAE